MSDRFIPAAPGVGLLDPSHPAVITEMERVASTFDPNRPWVNKNGQPYRLSDRIWDSGQSTRDAIDKAVKESIATGRDALKTAKDLEKYLNPALRPLRSKETGILLRNQPKSIVTATPGRGGKGSYAARRVMRTEVVAAHTQATQQAALLNPFAETLGYRLSPQHPAADECVIAGTLIRTLRGWEPIESIRVGDFVLTHRLRFRQVTTRFVTKEYSGQLIRVQVAGEHSRIPGAWMTPNHPVLTDRGWIPANDLQTESFGVHVDESMIERTDLPHGDGSNRALRNFVESVPPRGLRKRLSERRDAVQLVVFHKPRMNRLTDSVSTVPRICASGVDHFVYCRRSNLGFRNLFARLTSRLFAQAGRPIDRDGASQSLDYSIRFSADTVESNSVAIDSVQKPYRRFRMFAERKRGAFCSTHLNKTHSVATPERKRLHRSIDTSFRRDSFDCANCKHRCDCKTASEQIATRTAFSAMVASPVRTIRSAVPEMCSSYVDSNMVQTKTKESALRIDRKKVDKISLFNLAVSEDQSYIAGGIVVHNCDPIAEKDVGWGPGNYPIRDCPLPPRHPHCICRIEVNAPANSAAVVDALKYKYDLADTTAADFVMPTDRALASTQRAMNNAAKQISQRTGKTVDQLAAENQAAKRAAERAAADAAEKAAADLATKAADDAAERAAAARYERIKAEFEAEETAARLANERLAARIQAERQAALEAEAKEVARREADLLRAYEREQLELAERVPRTVIAEENAIREEAIEHAVLIDSETGDILLRKGGSSNMVAFTDAEAASMRDHILTHNHPAGWLSEQGNPPRIGNSFSPADIQMAVRYDLKSIRAVTPRYRLEITRPAGGWPDSGIVDAYTNVFNGEVQAQFFGEINAGTRTVQQAGADHWYEVNKRLADKFNWDYRVIDDPHPNF